MRLNEECVPTLKLFNYCFRSVILQSDYRAAKERSDFAEVEELKDTAINLDELLVEEYVPRTAGEEHNIVTLKEWIVKQESKGKLVSLGSFSTVSDNN